MIVWVASYPRSGNRLCRATLRQAFGEQHVGSAASDVALRNDLKSLLDELGVGEDADPLPVLRQLDQPVFLKTHSLPQHIHWLPTNSGGILQRAENEAVPEVAEDSPAIYLVRDGRDCLVSFAHYLKEISDRPRFRPMSHDEAVADLMRRKAPYGGWSGNVGAWRRREGPTEIVRFEDLIENPLAAIGRAADALGLELAEPRAEPPSFEELRERSRRPKLLRRGEAGSWRSEFPPDLLPEFWRRHGEQMEALGYPRE